MQASRLLSILMLLQARGRMTAAELAEVAEVSQRTILRDIDQLSAAGVPLWGERGRGGGFELKAGWSTQLTGMTEDEANALLLAGLPGPATELGLGSAAASARLKLLASLPGAWRDQSARVGERLHIDSVDWYRSSDSPRFLKEVAQAVWDGQRIRVRYQSWRGVTDRNLEPLGLVLKAGAWYVVAGTSGRPGWRVYRLASLLALDAARKSAFQRPRRFDLAKTWNELAASFEATLRPLSVHVRVSPRGLVWLTNARIPTTPLPVSARKRPPAAAGWTEVILQVESAEHGARQLLGFGSEIEVLSPVEVRTALVAEVSRLAAIYASGKRRVRRPAASGTP